MIRFSLVLLNFSSCFSGCFFTSQQSGTCSTKYFFRGHLYFLQRIGRQRKKKFFFSFQLFFFKEHFLRFSFSPYGVASGWGGGVADPQMKAQLTCGAGGLRLVLLRSVPSNSSVFTWGGHLFILFFICAFFFAVYAPSSSSSSSSATVFLFTRKTW